MQLKISRSTGNYLALNLQGATLTHFTAAGEVGIQLIDGKEGDDQFRQFLAQVVELEEQPKLFDAQIGGGVRMRVNVQADKVRELMDENAELREKLSALTERIEELTSQPRSCVAAPVAESVLETNVPRPAKPAPKPNPEHIFNGKSRPWLEGFAANRSYRLDLKECEELNSQCVPVEPRNPYEGEGGPGVACRRSWECGWLECLEYSVTTMPDPTSHLEKAK